MITSNYGSIRLEAIDSRDDFIYTSVHGTSAGLIAIGDCQAVSSVSGHIYTVIERGVSICNTFGSITISAMSAVKNMTTIGDFGAGGLSAKAEMSGI